MSRDQASDLLARTAVGLMFALLSVNLFQDFTRTHRVTGLLLLVGEALVVLLTIVRRRAERVDRSALVMAITTISLLGPPLFRATQKGGLVPDEVTAVVSIAGLALVIAGKLTLGRSFGIVPANRGVVAQGPYRLVRHPIYAGYLVTHFAFLAAHPTPMNLAIVIVSDSALVLRALFEERVLEGDERYRAYCTRVGWHLVPGVF